MHSEILSKEQIKLLPLVSLFFADFGLVGGTAIALHLGHRQSIDFDLFTIQEFQNSKIRRKIEKIKRIDKVYRDERDQYTFLIDGVHFTFFHYPFEIEYSDKFKSIVKIPDLLTLAAMKAYALGRRVKWKDYVDLYFILNSRHSLVEIVKKSKEIFGQEFNEKTFREQLCYFEGMNYSEEVVFMPGFAVSDKEIKKALVEFSLS